MPPPRFLALLTVGFALLAPGALYGFGAPPTDPAPHAVGQRARGGEAGQGAKKPAGRANKPGAKKGGAPAKAAEPPDLTPRAAAGQDAAGPGGGAAAAPHWAPFKPLLTATWRGNGQSAATGNFQRGFRASVAVGGKYLQLESQDQTKDGAIETLGILGWNPVSMTYELRQFSTAAGLDGVFEGRVGPDKRSVVFESETKVAGAPKARITWEMGPDAFTELIETSVGSEPFVKRSQVRLSPAAAAQASEAAAPRYGGKGGGLPAARSGGAREAAGNGEARGAAVSPDSVAEFVKKMTPQQKIEVDRQAKERGVPPKTIVEGVMQQRAAASADAGAGAKPGGRGPGGGAGQAKPSGRAPQAGSPASGRAKPRAAGPAAAAAVPKIDPSTLPECWTPLVGYLGAWTAVVEGWGGATRKTVRILPIQGGRFLEITTISKTENAVTGRTETAEDMRIVGYDEARDLYFLDEYSGAGSSSYEGRVSEDGRELVFESSDLAGSLGEGWAARITYQLPSGEAVLVERLEIQAPGEERRLVGEAHLTRAGG